MRPKWAAITVRAALRYFTASSGFWNWAMAGTDSVDTTAASVREASNFM